MDALCGAMDVPKLSMEQTEARVFLRTHHCLASSFVQADFLHSLSPGSTPSQNHAFPKP